MATNRLSSLRSIALTLVISTILRAPARALEITFEGKTYRNIEILELKDGNVTFLAKEETITVPRDTLTWQLEYAVVEFEKADQIANNPAQRPLLPDGPRAWIYGPVGAQKPNGITVVSSEHFLPAKLDRTGNTIIPDTEKSGVPVYNSTVFVRNAQQKAESQFDHVLWRDGFETIDGVHMPAFTTKDPGPIQLPNLTAERNWTNLEGKQLTAALRSLNQDIGTFVRPNGTEFDYPLENLIQADRTLIEASLIEYQKILDQLRKDHPGQKLNEVT